MERTALAKALTMPILQKKWWKRMERRTDELKLFAWKKRRFPVKRNRSSTLITGSAAKKSLQRKAVDDRKCLVVEHEASPWADRLFSCQPELCVSECDPPPPILGRGLCSQTSPISGMNGISEGEEDLHETSTEVRNDRHASHLHEDLPMRIEAFTNEPDLHSFFLAEHFVSSLLVSKKAKIHGIWNLKF